MELTLKPPLVTFQPFEPSRVESYRHSRELVLAQEPPPRPRKVTTTRAPVLPALQVKLDPVTMQMVIDILKARK